MAPPTVDDVRQASARRPGLAGWLARRHAGARSGHKALLPSRWLALSPRVTISAASMGACIAAEHRHQPGGGNHGCRLAHGPDRPGHLIIIGWIRRMCCRPGESKGLTAAA